MAINSINSTVTSRSLNNFRIDTRRLEFVSCRLADKDAQDGDHQKVGQKTATSRLALVVPNGDSRGPEGAGHFDGGLSAGHFDAPDTKKPRPEDANLTDMPLRGPL